MNNQFLPSAAMEAGGVRFPARVTILNGSVFRFRR